MEVWTLKCGQISVPVYYLLEPHLSQVQMWTFHFALKATFSIGFGNGLYPFVHGIYMVMQLKMCIFMYILVHVHTRMNSVHTSLYLHMYVPCSTYMFHTCMYNIRIVHTCTYISGNVCTCMTRRGLRSIALDVALHTVFQVIHCLYMFIPGG